jgi:hypothetical protein
VETGSRNILSVITVAAYDSERLKTTLESFQGSSNLIEFIVVCPSNDLVTKELLASSKVASDLKIRVHNDQGTGVYQAMNIGANLSEGEYLVFWNAGDYCSSIANLHALAVELESSSPEWGVFDAEFDWREKQVLNASNLKKFSLQRGGYISHQSVVMKKSAFKLHGGFDLSFKVAADSALMTKFWKVYKVKFFNYSVVNVEFPNFSGKFNRLGRIENFKIACLIIPWKYKFVTIGFAMRRELQYAYRRIFSNSLRTEEK